MSLTFTNRPATFLMGNFVGTAKRGEFTNGWNGEFKYLPDGRVIISNKTIIRDFSLDQDIFEFEYQTPGYKKANDMPYPFKWYESAVKNTGGVRNVKEGESGFLILEKLNQGKGHIDCLRAHYYGTTFEGAYQVCKLLGVDADDAVYLLGSLAEEECSSQWADASRARKSLFALFADKFEIEL